MDKLKLLEKLISLEENAGAMLNGMLDGTSSKPYYTLESIVVVKNFQKSGEKSLQALNTGI